MLAIGRGHGLQPSQERVGPNHRRTARGIRDGGQGLLHRYTSQSEWALAFHEGHGANRIHITLQRDLLAGR